MQRLLFVELDLDTALSGQAVILGGQNWERFGTTPPRPVAGRRFLRVWYHAR